MDEIHFEDIREQVKEHLQKVENELVLVAPFISKEGATFLMNNIPPAVGLKRLVVAFDYMNFIRGFTDFNAIRMLAEDGFSVEFMRNLHAKFILADKQHLLLGSANFTAAGLNLKGKASNQELIQISEINADAAEKLVNHFRGTLSFDKVSEKPIARMLEKAREQFGSTTVKESKKFKNIKEAFDELIEREERDFKTLEPISQKKQFMMDLAEASEVKYESYTVPNNRDVFYEAKSGTIAKVKVSSMHKDEMAAIFYTFGTSAKSVSALKNRLVHCFVLLIRGETGDLQPEYFAVPISELKYFTQFSRYAKSGFKVFKEEGTWYMNSKFYNKKNRVLSKKGFWLKMSLSDFQNKAPHEVKGMKHNLSRYRFGNKEDRNATMTFFNEFKK
jgi:hypothetical protein